MTQPPGEALKQAVDGFKLAQAIYVAAELGIADLLPRSADELAAETGTDARTLYRLLRALAAAGFFHEEAGRAFSLAPDGQALRADADPSLRDWVLHTARPVNWNTWAGLLDSVRDGSNAFARVQGEEMWSYRAARPAEQAAFDRGMASLTQRENAGLLGAVDWTRFGTVVDIGGGNGELLRGLLAVHPGMRGVLFDQSVVVEAVEGLDVAAGDFFESVPEGGDAYVLKHILHDWGDLNARGFEVDSPGGARRGVGPRRRPRSRRRERGARGEARRPEHARAPGGLERPRTSSQSCSGRQAFGTRGRSRARRGACLSRK